jgi:glycosyltransferase involved in cell wall biosynthesis
LTTKTIDRTPKDPPTILPLDLQDRPQWSVMIPVYNSGRYLEETLRSVLIQKVPEDQMQIEVIDDCSTDINVEWMVNKVGGGRIGYYRQSMNVGSLRNFETCINRAKGHFVHLLHSDDVILPGFYDHVGKLFNTYPEAGAAFTAYRYIDENSNILFYPEPEAREDCILPEWLPRLAERQRIQYACIAVRRSVYEQLGAFCGVHYGEDWEMWARIAAHYPMAYTPTVYASYRRHLSSISGQSIITAQNLKDLDFVMRKVNTYLPSEYKARALREARKFYAFYGVRTAKLVWTKLRNRRAAVAQIKAAWSMHKDLPLALEILKVLARMILNR